MSGTVRRAFFVGLLAWSVAGCVEKSDNITTAERDQIEKWVSKTPPKPEQEIGAELAGGKIELLGYDIKAAPPVKPGKAFAITWYWKANEAVDAGWRLFTHLANAENVSLKNEDASGALRQAYQPSAWKPGEYIEDTQLIMVPESWDSPKVTIYLGIWKGNERLPVTKGPNDGENRIRAVTLDVLQKDVSEGDTLPELHVTRADEGPAIDGKLDDAVWKKANTTDAFVNTMNGKSAEPNAHVKAAWDEENLYLAFEVEDPLLKSKFQKDDDHLWEQDAVEVMFDPGGDGKNYFEMQVAPTGKVFDTRYDSRRVPKPFGHVDWNAEPERAVHIQGDGKLNDDGSDEGYIVEMAIPWKAFDAGEPAAERPEPGSSWRVNFYVMDMTKDGQRAVGWSPPKVGDFHVPDRFGKLVFDPATEATVEADEGSTAPAKAAAKPAPKGGATGKKPRKSAKAEAQAEKASATPTAKPTKAKAKSE